MNDRLNPQALETPLPPFEAFARALPTPTPERAAISAQWHAPEAETVAALLPGARISDPAQREAIATLARRLTQGLRSKRDSTGVQALVHTFSLSSQEGIALMCLAEALLRIPDSATRDALIRDKLGRGNWQAHLGQSPSLFVNAATWGLVITGKLTATSSEKTLSSALTRLIARGGEPLIRQGVNLAMRLMGEQFVCGQTIQEALDHARKLEAQGFRYSYDMLGEAAATEADALRYLASYEQAIHAIGRAAAGRGIYDGPGISVKLSALHPRYSRAQHARVMAELYPRLLTLVELAQHYDIGLNIDAEEADRLELSLDLLETLCREPALVGWNGIGFVVQAYQKRCPQVIRAVIALARQTGRRLMVRLVKGAYWDSEIKRAQIDGLPDYPVYTRKDHTDVAYLACARLLLAAPEAVYPQFATHNAQTLATIYVMAGRNYYPGQYEFQCLHGMGEGLYSQVTGPVSAGGLARPCRIYAPVGTHETLLAYLVRRLLENGANTSFVHRVGDDSIPLDDLVADPVEQAFAQAVREGRPVGSPHPAIAAPTALLAGRLQGAGLNLAHEPVLAALAPELLRSAQTPWRAAWAGAADSAPGEPVRNPAQPDDVVGQVVWASESDVDAALAQASAAAPAWSATPPSQRAAVLRRAADALEAAAPTLLGLLVREAGKSLANGVAEVREAVDFLRYDAQQLEVAGDAAVLQPWGVALCISPWNFPLAIFVGQIAAALAAGNAVVAKPAEQTPLVAALAARLLHEAGVPAPALQLLPGDGAVGARLVADARVAAVLFTGSTAVARAIAGTLSSRAGPGGQAIPLIAETGGQNALIVDSSALAEQVVADVLASAFDSAGQRCSAVRLLCVQDDGADRLLTLLREAMAELEVGAPEHLHTDVGPVIDAEAQGGITAHIAALQKAGLKVTRAGRRRGQGEGAGGHFVAPALIELDRLDRLEREIFGPVLHVLRYRRDDLPALLDQLHALGYGLTLGVHSRIDETIAAVCRRSHAGNLYVNRNTIGAVVGVQPFGGMGLSGTGPKAGGPLYLRRLVQDGGAADALLGDLPPPLFAGLLPVAGDGDGATAPDFAALRQRLDDPAHTATLAGAARPALQAWLALGAALWAPGAHGVAGESLGLTPDELALAQTAWQHSGAQLRQGADLVLPGPTGERNSYALCPRGRLAAVARTRLGAITQMLATLAQGNTLRLQWLGAGELLTPAWPRLGSVLHVGADALTLDTACAHDDISAVLIEVDADGAGAQSPLQALSGLNARSGPQRPVVRGVVRSTASLQAGAQWPWTALVHEQVISVNTAAAGGNAALMTLG
ncbi:bifunctional proline dehydrogenase/L-glutamate gamma-semialdehyde dehydrogenase PutA [Amphibiibacter pelophylacis]|uniref:Bifunctional proline dehydrogenase/L-glutamate gamma-semialdehyde dehydrogenase PutA n=1 Tax=Amphibiibacter pelophylacis TaxID=1799477 RepID=A0ACC6P341_9BURK